METNYEETVKQLTDFLSSETKTEAVVGKPFELGEFTCVPVIRLGIGLGYGGGKGQGQMPDKGHGEGGGSGAGGGVGVAPIGFLVTRADQISFIPASSGRGLGAAFEKVPDLIEKFMDRKKAAQEPVK